MCQQGISRRLKLWTHLLYKKATVHWICLAGESLNELNIMYYCYFICLGPQKLSELPFFLHGMLPHPSNLYLSIQELVLTPPNPPFLTFYPHSLVMYNKPNPHIANIEKCICTVAHQNQFLIYFTIKQSIKKSIILLLPLHSLQALTIEIIIFIIVVAEL